MKKCVGCEISKDHYEADACIVWCYDHRFSEALKALLLAKGIQKYDLVCVAGGANALSSSVSMASREFVLSQIETSARLHKTKKIILMMHKDCGAYGGSKAFDNDQKETEFLELKLSEAKEFLSRQISVPIEKVIVDFNGIFDTEA